MPRERALKVVLVLLGLFFFAGLYPVTMCLWHPKGCEYADSMMLSIYVTLGIFLLLAVRNPSVNRNLIAFTAWSSFAHAAVMTVQAFKNVSEHGDFLYASALLVIIGIVLLALAPAKQPVEQAPA